MKTAFTAALLAGAFVAISATPPAHANPGRQEFLACVHGGPGNIGQAPINVDDDAKLREEMVARSGRRTVPQIFIGETHVGGCDDLLALEGSGELDRLIGGLDERG